ncbi:MAG: GNAT family N-acetyltransferase, partial [Alphaproteobacteria bacterium]
KARLLGAAGLDDTEEPIFTMTITLLGVDRYLGSCGLSPTDQDGSIEVYFTLVPAAQGHGYATETVEALVEFARGNGMQQMIARVFDGNRPSVGVLERAGFQMSQVVDDEFGSTSIYALNLQ